MKELDELKEKCVQAMKDVDAFVDEHYEELCNEIREQWNVSEGWIVKIVSNCGVVNGCFRQSEKDEWTRVIYNNGEWIDSNFFLRINMKKDHDYSVFLAIIAIWIMIGVFAQCESAGNLDDIRRELSDIRHELNMMRYK